MNVEFQEWKDFNSRAEKANALPIPIEALNSMKTSGTYWMNDPSAYMEDGSYVVSSIP